MDGALRLDHGAHRGEAAAVTPAGILRLIRDQTIEKVRRKEFSERMTPTERRRVEENLGIFTEAMDRAIGPFFCPWCATLEPDGLHELPGEGTSVCGDCFDHATASWERVDEEE